MDAWLAEHTRESTRIAGAWRERLDSQQVERVEHALDRSGLRSLWPGAD